MVNGISLSEEKNAHSSKINTFLEKKQLTFAMLNKL